MVSSNADSGGASPDKVVERLEARRDQTQKHIVKFRFRWLFLIVAFLIGAAFNAAIDAISGVFAPAGWYQGGVGVAVLYLFFLGLIQGSLRGDLRETNRTLSGSDSNRQTSTIPPSPPSPRRRYKPVRERTWKDHPLVVATVAIVGTTYLMFTAVIPTWLREKDNEIATLKTEPTRLKNELDDVSGQLRRMESANVKLRRDLDRLSPDSLFSLDDVYPKGFRAVRIGDRIDLLKEVYGSEAVEDEGSWVSVNLKNPQLFSQITYYYDENARLKTVTFILFQFNNKDGRTFDLLKQQLIDKYGFPKLKEGKGRWRKSELEWSGVNKHVIRLGDGTLHIERSD